jgi:urease accessory protein
MRCSRPDGHLLCADTTVLEPRRSSPTRPGLFAEHTDMGTMYVVAEQAADTSKLATAIHDGLQGLRGVVGSASVMPSGCGVHARLLGTGTRFMEGALHRCWETTRTELLNVAVPNIYTTKHGFRPTLEMEPHP